MTTIVYKNRFAIRSKRRALTVGYDMQRGAEAAFYTACLPSLELTAALFNPPCFDLVCQAGVFFFVGCRPFLCQAGLLLLRGLPFPLRRVSCALGVAFPFFFCRAHCPIFGACCRLHLSRVACPWCAFPTFVYPTYRPLFWCGLPFPFGCARGVLCKENIRCALVLCMLLSLF